MKDKIFYWKPFIKKIGIAKFISFCIVLLLTSVMIVLVFKKNGVFVCFQSIGISIIINDLERFKNEIKKITEEYEIDK